MKREIAVSLGHRDEHGIAELLRGVLESLGEDVTRDGLAETPERVARMLLDATRERPMPALKVFDGPADPGGHAEMIMQDGIKFSSLCEHHLLPFAGEAIVAYIPNKSGKVVGLSKLARTVEWAATGFQTQERITTVIAQALERVLEPRGVAVLLRAEHSCMSVRGVRAHGAVTTTSKLTGAFYDDPRCRAEFMALAARPR